VPQKTEEKARVQTRDGCPTTACANIRYLDRQRQSYDTIKRRSDEVDAILRSLKRK